MNDSGKNLRDLVVKVLCHLGQMYPNSSIAKKLEADNDQIFETLIAVWMTGLTGLTEDKVAKGLKAVMDSGNTFEPSIPEFVKMCKASRPEYLRPGGTYKPLPPPPEGGAPASLDCYPVSVQKQLENIEMMPHQGETKHQYAMRCKDYVMDSRYGRAVGHG